MKPVWWTCGCGRRNCSPQPGPIVCKCGKPAQFAREAPRAQQTMSFGEVLRTGLDRCAVDGKES